MTPLTKSSLAAATTVPTVTLASYRHTGVMHSCDSTRLIAKRKQKIQLMAQSRRFRDGASTEYFFCRLAVKLVKKMAILVI